MFVLAQLSQRSSRHAGGQTKILFLHILIDQKLPQFVVANSHNNTPCIEFAPKQHNFNMSKGRLSIKNPVFRLKILFSERIPCAHRYVIQISKDSFDSVFSVYIERA